MPLSGSDGDTPIEITRETARMIKALFADPHHQLALQFIVNDLCGQRRLSFVPGVPEATELMIHREGRRFVGEWLMRIVETAVPDELEDEPVARTMTAKAERRNKQQ